MKIKNDLKIKIYYLLEFTSVYALQIVNIAFPLMIIPILIRALGADSYGILSFHQTMVMIAMVLVDFSFNYSATRQIAAASENLNEVNNIFWKYIYTKLTLLVFVCLLLIAASIYEKIDGLLILCFSPMLLGTVLFPIWFFQGLGLMRNVAIPHIISKITVFFLILILVNKSSSIYIVALLVGSVYLLSGLLAVLYISKLNYIKIIPYSFHRSLSAIRESSTFFAGMASMSLYTHAGMLLVGFMSDKGNAGVGYFAVGSKLRNGVSNLAHPVGQVLFHRISKLYDAGGKYPRLGVIAVFAQFLIALLAFFIYLVFQNQVVIIFSDSTSMFAEELIFFLVVGGFIQVAKNSIFLQVFSATGADALFRNLTFFQLPILATVLFFNWFQSDMEFTRLMARSLLLADILYFSFLGSFAILYIRKINKRQ